MVAGCTTQRQRACLRSHMASDGSKDLREVLVDCHGIRGPPRASIGLRVLRRVECGLQRAVLRREEPGEADGRRRRRRGCAPRAQHAAVRT